MNFKKVNNRLARTYSNSGRTYGMFQLGQDATGKPVCIGCEVDFVLDTLFTNGSASNYGKGSICMRTAGGVSIVDADGLWQAVTATTVSQSASPSSSVSPSSSASSSASRSTSPSLSPSASGSSSVSPSLSPSASASPSA